MATDSYGIYIACLVGIVFIILIASRVALIRRRRLQAEMVLERRRTGLPLPVTSSNNDPEWRMMMGQQPYPPTNGAVVRVESRTADGDLPSYNAPGIKVPETIYNPHSPTHVTPTVPYAPPAGAPPGYSEASRA